MSVSSRRALQALIAMGVSAVPASVLAAPPVARDYTGPEAVPGTPPSGSPPIETPPATPPTATPPTATPPAEAPPTEAPPSKPPTKPPVEPPVEDDGGDGFVVEDLTEDPDALKKELEVKTTEVKGPSGTVKGKVKDATTGEPMIGAYVEAIGTPYKTKTDLEGDYTLPLPPGTYELRIRYDTSESRRFSGVVVKQGEEQTIGTELKPLAGANQTVAVKAEMNRESEGARLLQRKESAASRDILSRQEISKSGGGSTAAVAVRIVGATVIDGKYLFVRGLGHRYGNTLFDGARVPSPEPELRTVPLDIFPSGALSAINVQKTFTPDMPGDFAGGSVQLESREVPKKLTVEIGAAVGFNTETTFRDYVFSGPFPGQDAFGFGNLPRGLSKQIPTKYPASRGAKENFKNVFTPADIERFGEAMYTDTRVRTESAAPPNFGLKATVGYGFSPHNHGKLGFLGSAAYKYTNQTIRPTARLYGATMADGLDQVTPRVDYTGIRTTMNVQWSAVGLVKYEANENHKLSLLTFYSRDADDETRRYEGVARNISGEPLVTTRLRYVMRSVLMTRLGGVHEFPKAKGLTLDWFGSYAQARRDDPAIREMLFADEDEDGTYQFDLSNEGAKQTFLGLLDHTESGAANLTMPFKQWRQLDSKAKIGAWVEGKQRGFEVRRFNYLATGGLQPLVPVGTGNIVNNRTIGDGTPNTGTEPFYLQENTRDNDNYRARQEVYATYGMLELPFVRWFKITGGARFEANRMRVEPYNLFDKNDTSVAEMYRAAVKDNEVLPMAGLIFPATRDMNVRLSAAKTVGRPEFREIAPFQFTDFVGGASLVGNTGLHSFHIWNADARWEWFPSAAEVVAISFFYKYFDEPIERVAFQTSSSQAYTWRNADYAHNVGVEVEFRKNLEFIAKRLRDLSIGFNAAYVYSVVHLPAKCSPDDPSCNVDVPETSTSRVRALQGQAPLVANAYLDYGNDKSGTGVRLLYNTVFRNIAYVGRQILPDIYEEARHQLDFVFSQRIGGGVSMNFQIDNMLAWPIRYTQGKGGRNNPETGPYPGTRGPGEALYLRYDIGTTFVIGLSYDLAAGRKDRERVAARRAAKPARPTDPR